MIRGLLFFAAAVALFGACRPHSGTEAAPNPDVQISDLKLTQKGQPEVLNYVQNSKPYIHSVTKEFKFKADRSMSLAFSSPVIIAPTCRPQSNPQVVTQ